MRVPVRGKTSGDIQRREVIAWLPSDRAEEASRIDRVTADEYQIDNRRVRGNATRVGVPVSGKAGGGIQRSNVIAWLPSDGAKESSHVEGVGARDQHINDPIRPWVPIRVGPPVRKNFRESVNCHGPYLGEAAGNVEGSRMSGISSNGGNATVD